MLCYTKPDTPRVHICSKKHDVCGNNVSGTTPMWQLELQYSMPCTYMGFTHTHFLVLSLITSACTATRRGVNDIPTSYIYIYLIVPKKNCIPHLLWQKCMD